MDNVKDDRYFLEKITSDLKFVIDHTQGMTQEEMTENDLLIDSVMFRIVQVAENGAKLSVKRFVRFETGEGLEKKNEDFAAEVAAQMNM